MRVLMDCQNISIDQQKRNKLNTFYSNSSKMQLCCLYVLTLQTNYQCLFYELTQTNAHYKQKQALYPLILHGSLHIINNIKMKQDFSDQRLEAIFSKLSVADTQKLLCPQGNEINKLCTNSECKNALLCSEEACNSCGDEIHPLCSTTSFNSIKSCLKKQARRHKEFLYAIFEIENKFISQIYERRSKLIKEYQYNFVGFNFRDLLIEVFNKKNNKALNGQKAQQFHCYLKKAIKQADDKVQKWTKQYQSYLEGVQTQMAQRNQMFFEAFAEKKPIIESKILMQTHKIQVAQMQYLEKTLEKFTKMDLIFRGSEHEFSAKCFHAKCDNEQNTLTLIKTQHGKTVAGFTKAKWALDGTRDMEKKKHAFLLQLDTMQKFVPKTKNQGILYDAAWGPVFGNGGQQCDISICDNCHTVNNCYSNFPSQFNREGADQLEKNDQSCQNFIGRKNKQRFAVQEYEVFKVSYE